MVLSSDMVQKTRRGFLTALGTGITTTGIVAAGGHQQVEARRGVVIRLECNRVRVTGNPNRIDRIEVFASGPQEGGNFSQPSLPFDERFEHPVTAVVVYDTGREIVNSVSSQLDC